MKTGEKVFLVLVALIVIGVLLWSHFSGPSSGHVVGDNNVIPAWEH